MIPPLIEKSVEEEIEGSINPLIHNEDSTVRNYSTIKGIVFLLFLVLFFAMVSVATFLLQTTSFEDQKYGRLQHLLKKYTPR